MFLNLNLFLYDKAETLKQRLATVFFCDGEMEQHIAFASKDVLGYMDGHSKGANSQKNARESFRNRFASFVERL